MRTRKNMLALSIMFLVFAAAFSVIFWLEVSLAAKICLVALGFGSGLCFRDWFIQKSV
jgi:hypothetical protein